ncbi:MAG: hypothetical protein Roseis2KO_14160 [Roseivirga sp.]
MIEPTYSDQKIKYEIDSVTIDVGDYGLFHYPVFSVAEIDSVNYYFGWNNKTRSLNIVNLDEQRLERSIFYDPNDPNDPNGPDGVGEVKGMTVQNFDSIFFMSNLNISLMDTASVLRSKWGINDRNEFSGFDKYNHNLTTEESFNILYDKGSQKMYVRLHFPQYPWCDPSLDYYKENMIAELDLVSKRFREVKMPFPEYFQKENYGFRNIPSVTKGDENSLNITFSVSANIYELDIESDIVNSFGGKSEFTENHASSLDQDDCQDTQAGMKHNLRNVKYLQLHFDPYRQLYYRFHWSEVAEHSSDGKLSSYRNKRLYLSVFDSSFNKVAEWDIDRKHGASWCFVTRKGFYVLKPRGEENLLGFNVFRVGK